MKSNTPKSFVLQLGSLAALYAAITGLLILLFSIINLQFPDEAASFYEGQSARESIRMAIALLVVIFPAFVLLTRMSHQERRQHEHGDYTTLAKWLVYLSLFIGGAALLSDLVTLIVYFLNGEITTRFVLKVVVFFAVVASAFTYFLYDVKGYFTKHERQSIQIAAATAVIVIVSLIAGFMYIETPAEVREIKLDEQQINDLQLIQSRIEEYYLVRGGFPETIDDLFSGETLPHAPTGRTEYRYVLTGEKSYELCATFAAESQDLGRYPSAVFPMKVDNYSWDHGTGEKCFARVIVDQQNLEIIN